MPKYNNKNDNNKDDNNNEYLYIFQNLLYIKNIKLKRIKGNNKKGNIKININKKINIKCNYKKGNIIKSNIYINKNIISIITPLINNIKMNGMCINIHKNINSELRKIDNELLEEFYN